MGTRFGSARLLVSCVFSLTACLTTPSVVFAQDRGAITGMVTDATGGVLPGVDVTARNIATGLVQSTVTGDDGTYDIPYLPVGNYTVTAEIPSFRTAAAPNVTVNVGATARLDFRLEVGEITEVVEVAPATPLLQTERTDLGMTFDSQKILQLPLSLTGGLRNNLEFVALVPGVIATPGDNASLRIGGGLSTGHSMLLDGAEAASERRNDPGFQSVSTEAIGEFRVMTSNYSAEYGRTANGIINFTTKSGTNDLHGSLFEFFRDDAFNARGFFNEETPVLRQHIYGGSIGGPVSIPKVLNGRDRAFFFFALERSHHRAGAPSGLVSLPPLAMREGDFREWKDAAGNIIPIYDPATTGIEGGAVVRDQFSCQGQLNVICPDRIDPVAQFLNNLLPPPELSDLLNNTRAVGNPGSNQDVYSIKGDYVFSANNRVNGLFSRQAFDSPDPIGPIPGPLGDNFKSFGVTRFYRISHDSVLRPNLVNHFTFGWNKREIGEEHPQRLTEDQRSVIQLKGATGDPTAPSVYILGDGYPRLNFWVNTASPSRTLSINEQLSWTKGRHGFKFGFTYLRQDYRRIDCNGCAGEAGFSRAVTGLPAASGVTGSSYASFLLGLPSSGFYNFGGDFSFGQPYYAWYVQDDFRVTPRLTLNLGLRYEIPVPKSEKDGQNSNLCLTCPNPAAGGIPGAMEFAGEGAGRTGQERFTDTRYNAWGPRMGIAYRMLDDTVIRAGGGIFYVPMREGGNADRGVQGFGGNFQVASPDGISPAFTLDKGFPSAEKPPLIDPGLNLFGSPYYQAPEAGRAPYMGDWNLTVEQGLGANTVIRASYQGNAGVKLFANRELLNQVDPRFLSLGELLFLPIGSEAARDAGIPLPWSDFPLDRSVGQALRPFPQYTGIDRIIDADVTGHSTYHALTVSAERRFADGLSFLTSYTFGKLISNVQGENPALGGFLANGDVGTQNDYDRRADKAVSNQDVPHRLVISYVYELPIGRGKKYLADAGLVADTILGGWRISGVHTYQSGYPLRVLSNQNPGIFSGTIRANLEPDVPLKNPSWDGDPSAAPYINPEAFSRPPNFTFGNSAANLDHLRSPALFNEDIALSKDVALPGEDARVEFRASFFNIFNRTQFGGIVNQVESADFGQVTSQANHSREVQLALRLIF
ncbi:MAG: TonB-dependent receptor plug domain-containing protein [Luteitalea sp.]|nr:TonB-dependent receptor plug domain-containing protein [Luteitalea sp.]